MPKTAKIEQPAHIGPTPGPWRVAFNGDGEFMKAPEGLTAEQAARWDALVAERNKPLRDNDGSFRISSDAGPIGTAVLRASDVKRTQRYNAEDPEGFANARLLAAAPELLAALEACAAVLVPRDPARIKAEAAIAKARGE